MVVIKSELIVKMKKNNVLALALRDRHESGGVGNATSHYPKRWTGKVTNIGNQLFSGEWEVKITSKYLEEQVTARVNVFRKVGTPVQFCLDDTDKFGKTAVTMFEKNRKVDPRTNEASEEEDNPAWQKDRFQEADYDDE